MVSAVAVREAKKVLGTKGNSLRSVKTQLAEDRARLSSVEDELDELQDRISDLEYRRDELEAHIEAATLLQEVAEKEDEEEEPIRTHSAIRPKSERSLSCFES